MTCSSKDASNLKSLISLVANAVAANRPGDARKATAHTALVGQADSVLRALMLGSKVPATGTADTMRPTSETSKSFDDGEWREVLRLAYLAHLGREPAESECAAWLQSREVEEGSSILFDTLRSIAASDEAARFREQGSLLDVAPIVFAALYANCLGRPANAPEIADRVADLKKGGSFGASVLSIINSDEARAFATSNSGPGRSLRWMPSAQKRFVSKGKIADFLKERPIAELALIPAETQSDAGARRIAIDALQIVPGVSGGVEVYMKTLIRAIQAIPEHDVVLVCQHDQVESYMSMFGSRVGYCFPDLRSDDLDLRWIASLRENDATKLAHVDTKATFRTLKAVTAADVLHSPVQIFSHYDSQIPSVLNLHDLQHLHMPENFSAADIAARNDHYGRSACLADIIIASSQFVSDDIVNRLHIKQQKMHVIPATWNPDLNVDMDVGGVSRVQAKYKLPANFVFFPGQFWKHKNQARLVQAVARARTRLESLDLHLVLTGYRGHTGWPEVERAIFSTGMTEKVMCLDYISIEDLPGVYKSALACIVPSLFEASSYPVIEAQRIGCPSACSTVTSLPELMADGAGLLFDPFDTNDIASAIEKLCSDEQLRLRIISTARKKVERDHSMAAYIKGIHAIYETLAQSSRTSSERKESWRISESPRK